MGLADEVTSVRPYRKKAWVLDQLGPDADDFLALLADPKVSFRTLHRALTRRGIEIPDRTIFRWCQEARR
jgi:hypothetical protein